MARPSRTRLAFGMLLCGVANCSSAEGSAQAQAPQAQLTTENMLTARETPPPTDLRARYDEWVSIATEEIEAHFDVFNHVMTSEWAPLHFEAAECSPQETSDGYIGLFEDSPPQPTETELLDSNLRALAHRMTRYRLSLIRGGYPEQIWAAPVQRYEEAMLNEIRRYPTLRSSEVERSPAEEQALDYYRIPDEIEAARASAAPHLPPVMRTFDCGGEVIAIWRTSPEGGRVWLIDRMDFGWCRRRFGDPYDLSKCHRWEEVGPEQEVSVGGIYVTQARWPNGNRGTGVHTVIYDPRIRNERILYVRPSATEP